MKEANIKKVFSFNKLHKSQTEVFGREGNPFQQWCHASEGHRGCLLKDTEQHIQNTSLDLIQHHI